MLRSRNLNLVVLGFVFVVSSLLKLGLVHAQGFMQSADLQAIAMKESSKILASEAVLETRSLLWESDFKYDPSTTNQRPNWSKVLRHELAMTAPMLLATENMPVDMPEFCPRYIHLDLKSRLEVWADIIVAIGKPESNFGTKVATPDGNIGLFQLSKDTVNQNYGCNIRTNEELKNPEINIRCMVRVTRTLILGLERKFGPPINWGKRIASVNRNTDGLGMGAYFEVLRPHCRNASLGGSTQAWIKDQVRNNGICQ